jgi:hypothetical protein
MTTEIQTTENDLFTAIDLDARLEEAMLFINAAAIAGLIEERLLRHSHLVSGCPDSGMRRGRREDGASGFSQPALPSLGEGRYERICRQARSFLAHEMIEDVCRHEMDSLTSLELRCRKEEVSRKLDKAISTTTPAHTRQAA